MSLVATLMQPLIEMYERKRLDKNEILFSRYGAWNLFMAMNSQQNAILSPKNREDAENSYGNVSKIPVIDGDTVNIGTTRSCTIANSENTSHLIQLSFTPLAWGFTMFPNTYKTGSQPMNYVQYQNDFTTKVDKRTLALMSTVDTLARNAIEAAKNTYFPSNIVTAYYPVVGNAFQVTQAQKNDLFNQLSSIMQEYDFYNTTYILGNAKLKAITKRLENQGTGNATNEYFQFALGDFLFTTSNRVTNGGGVEATFYAIQEGNLAVVNRNNPDARAGDTIGGGEYPTVQWGTMMYPLLNMPVGTFYKNDCGDSTGVAAVANTATRVESFGWDTEICFLTPYNSDPSTKQAPIIKVEIAAP